MLGKKTQILITHGSDFEMGLQMGEASREFLPSSMISFYKNLWERMLNPKAGLIAGPKSKWVLEKILDKVFIRRLKSAQSSFIEARIRGLAEGLGLPFDLLFLLLLFPDLFPYFQNLAAKYVPSQFVLPHLPTFGCSSFFSKGNDFFYGRNLDFPGVGYWDSAPMIQLFVPKDGLKYLGITTAGVPLAGISGINEAGLMVALHQHYAKDISLKGELPYSIAERILKKETTLEGALEVIRNSKVSNPWAFLIAEKSGKKAALVEKSPSRQAVLPFQHGVLSHSNFFQTKPLRQIEYAATERMNWDNYFRKSRLEQLNSIPEVERGLKQHLSFLSESYDGFLKEEKYVNRTVSQLYNIQSFLIDVDRWKLWMADSSVPVHMGSYREWDLGKIFSESGSPETGAVEFGYQFQNKNIAEAKKNYVESFIACFDGENDLSIEKGKKALSFSFCTEAATAISILHLKRGEYREAAELLEKGKTHLDEKQLSKMPPEYFECSLFLVRALKLIDKKEEADRLSKTILNHPDFADRRIKKIMACEKMVSEKTLKKILVPFSSYIPFH